MSELPSTVQILDQSKEFRISSVPPTWWQGLRDVQYHLLPSRPHQQEAESEAKLGTPIWDAGTKNGSLSLCFKYAPREFLDAEFTYIYKIRC